MAALSLRILTTRELRAEVVDYHRRYEMPSHKPTRFALRLRFADSVRVFRMDLVSNSRVTQVSSCAMLSRMPAVVVRRGSWALHVAGALAVCAVGGGLVAAGHAGQADAHPRSRRA